MIVVQLRGTVVDSCSIFTAAATYLQLLWICSVLVLLVRVIPALLHQFAKLAAHFQWAVATGCYQLHSKLIRSLEP